MQGEKITLYHATNLTVEKSEAKMPTHLSKHTAKPFVKWAGGKGQLIEKLNLQYPSELLNGKITNYIEPFVGGGAVLFDVLQKFPIAHAVIIDVNAELINCYRCIKENVAEMINRLHALQNEFYALSSAEQAKMFDDVRKKYNATRLQNLCDFEKATQFIFLNRTCFNGLYRVNSKGAFNVPYGRYAKPTICDKENLILVSGLLQRVDILHGDYTLCLNFADAGSFVYLDPPYRPITETQSFVGYASGGFNDQNQIELAAVISELRGRWCKIMLSNSDPKNVNVNDNFFDDLYSGLTISRITARRMINCQADRRGEVTELLVCNY